MGPPSLRHRHCMTNCVVVGENASYAADRLRIWHEPSGSSTRLMTLGPMGCETLLVATSCKLQD